jgi:transcriptional regulator with XRE-family HTH domain
MQEQERRTALADFLRRQRARLTPGEVGLPVGLRRRTPGLRREEVAQLANIGTSWYIWLEQGRDVHPSAQVLESLANALQLTPNERRHLFLLAGQSLAPSPMPLEEQISPALQQMLIDLDPTPAYILGRRWDFLAWNRSADLILNISGSSAPYERNLLWRLFTNRVMRTSIANWEQMARGMVAEFRMASANAPDDGTFQTLIEDLKRVSPEFAQWWPHHDAPRSLNAHKIIEHITMGRLEFEHISLQVLGNSTLQVAIYMPDTSTRARLSQQFNSAVAHR